MRIMAIVTALLVLGSLPAPVAAEPIKVGSVKVAAFAPVYIAEERGYFAAEGVPAEIVWFDAAQKVAVATVAGDLDFGVAAMTGGFYNLAGQGALKLIAGAAREAPGFKNQAYFVSRQADAAGVKSLKDLPGHSYAITQTGAPPQYVLGLVSEKYGFDAKSVHLLALQSIPNIITAVAGGRADVTVTALTGGIVPLVKSGQVKLMAWVGDETPWQFGAVFTGTGTANNRPDTVQRFLRAYRKAAREYYDAFTAPDGTRRDGPTAPAILAILAKYTSQTVDAVALGIPYIDANGALDANDIVHQVNWYKAQGLVKPNVDGDALIDRRYVTVTAGR